jgi:hypothetical protein
MADEGGLRTLWLSVLQQAVRDAEADGDVRWLRSRDLVAVADLAGLDRDHAAAWGRRLADHIERVAADRRAAA